MSITSTCGYKRDCMNIRQNKKCLMRHIDDANTVSETTTTTTTTPASNSTAIASPRRKSCGELISIVSQSDDGVTICRLFHQHMKEIFSHPRQDITVNLVHLGLKNLSILRINLLTSILESPQFATEEQVEKLKLNVPTNADGIDIASLLRKRYKDTYLIEDIYILGMSIVEGKLHVEFHKSIVSAPKPPKDQSTKKSIKNQSQKPKLLSMDLASSNSYPARTNTPKKQRNQQDEVNHSDEENFPLPVSAAAAGSAATNTVETLPPPPSCEKKSCAVKESHATLSEAESLKVYLTGMKTMQKEMKSLIEQQQKIAATPLNPDTQLLSQKLVEISEALKGTRKENKELKNKLELLCTKFDKQNTDFLKLEKEHDGLLRLNPRSVLKNTASAFTPPAVMPTQSGQQSPIDLVQVGLQQKHAPLKQATPWVTSQGIHPTAVPPPGDTNSNSNSTSSNLSSRNHFFTSGSGPRDNADLGIGSGIQSPSISPPFHQNYAEINVPISNRFAGFDEERTFPQRLDDTSNNGRYNGGARKRDMMTPKHPPNFNMARSDDMFASRDNFGNRRRNSDDGNRRRNSDDLNRFNSNKINSTVQNKKSNAIFGTKQPNIGNTLAGQRSARNMDIFIGGINNRVTNDHLADYLKTVLQVEPLNITVNRRNENNQSFKVTIKASDKVKLLLPAAWEKNIIVKPFRTKKVSTSNDDNLGNVPSSLLMQQYDPRCVGSWY